MSYIAPTNVEAYELDTDNIQIDILRESVSRRVFNVAPMRKKSDYNYRYHDLLEDVKFTYGIKPVEIPRSTFALQPKSFEVPTIAGNYAYDQWEIDEIDAGVYNTSMRNARIAQHLRVQEDIIAFAGESTYNGVGGIADTTNVSTAASTELDLTNITTLKSSANAILNQLNNGLNNSSGFQTIKSLPIIGGVTSDVADRLEEMSPATDDFRDITGWDILNGILARRGGPGSEVVISNAVGGTVSKQGDEFYLATEGTTNAFFLAKSPMYSIIAGGPFWQTMDQEHGNIDVNMYEKWRMFVFKQASVIYSGTVDITG